MLDLIDTKGKKDIKSMTLEEGQSSFMTGYM